MRIFLASILIVYYFIVNYAYIVRFWGKILLTGPLWGGATIIPPSLKTKRNKKFFQDRPNFYIYF
jgi:hypothetical protein